MPSPTVALLTGEGVGAVAVVQVSGPGALATVDAVFRSATNRCLDPRAFDRPRFGRIGRGMGDEVVVLAAAEADVEIHCHGGTAAIELVIEALVAAGANQADKSRFVAGKPRSRVQAEALEDVARATTLRAAAHLLDQANGTLEEALHALLQRINAESPDAISQLDVLMDSAYVGLRLVGGWRVVLAGRPNVGKSRLLNALAGYDRSIVSGSAGTTRDFVSVRTAFDGWPVELVDTAGLRQSTDPLELAGIALARSVQAEADLILLVLDRSQPLTDEDRCLIEAFPGALILMNKCDLPAAWHRDALAVSAQRGDGIAELAGLIGRSLVPKPPSEGAPIVFRASHLHSLTLIQAALGKGDRGAASRALDQWLTLPAR